MLSQFYLKSADLLARSGPTKRASTRAPVSVNCARERDREREREGESERETESVKEREKERERERESEGESERDGEVWR